MRAYFEKVVQRPVWTDDDFAIFFETPCTPPFSALFSLEQKLADFDLLSFRRRVDDRYRRLSEWILSMGGEVKGGPPGLTFRLPESLKLEADRFWLPPGGEGWMQAFLWSGSDSEVDQLMADLTTVWNFCSEKETG